MRFNFRPINPAEDDLFGPLRDLRSPFSPEVIKALVLEQSRSGVSLWMQLRGLLAEFFAFGIVAAFAVNFTGLARDTSEPIISRSGLLPVSAASPIQQSLSLPTPVLQYLPAYSVSSSSHAASLSPSLTSNLTPKDPHPFDVPLSIMLHPGIRNSNALYLLPKFNSIDNEMQPSISDQTILQNSEWFSTVSGGAIFSHLRMVGERAEIGMRLNGWESIGVSFINTNGSRDWHDVLAHHSTASSLLFSENDESVALMLGGDFSVGAVSGKLEVGPAFLISTGSDVNPATLTLGSEGTTQRFGAEAAVSAYYNLNGFVKAGITGISTWETGQFATGILISVEIRP